MAAALVLGTSTLSVWVRVPPSPLKAKEKRKPRGDSYVFQPQILE